MIDKKLTQDIQLFLQKEKPTEDDVRAAAQLLLRINRNRMLYNNIIRRPSHYLPKLVHELKKHLRYRLDGLTLDEVRAMEDDVLPKVKDVLSTVPEGIAENGDTATPKLGKRTDHDSLPDEVKAYWARNIDRWKKIKENYETCLALDMACDRYEYLKALKQAYEDYKADMARYDSYDPNAATSGTGEEPKTPEEIVTDNAKTIGNARSYITNARKNLATFDPVKDAKKIETRRKGIQERVNLLVSLGAAVEDDTKKWLTDNGFTL